jgi:hypothetical protein
MDIAHELVLLEEAIDLCRVTIVENEKTLGHLQGRPGHFEVARLLAVYRNLLELQLRRRDELLANQGINDCQCADPT